MSGCCPRRLRTCLVLVKEEHRNRTGHSCTRQTTRCQRGDGPKRVSTGLNTTRSGFRMSICLKGQGGGTSSDSAMVREGRVWGASEVLKQRMNAPEREGIVMATTSQRKSERPAENGGVMVVGVGSQPRHAPQGHGRHRQAHVDPLPEGAVRRESCT